MQGLKPWQISPKILPQIGVVWWEDMASSVVMSAVGKVALVGPSSTAARVLERLHRCYRQFVFDRTFFVKSYLFRAISRKIEQHNQKVWSRIISWHKHKVCVRNYLILLLKVTHVSIPKTKVITFLFIVSAPFSHVLLDPCCCWKVQTWKMPEILPEQDFSFLDFTRKCDK